MARIPKADRIIQPQQGFQTKFLSTKADIAIGGGSAGGGKTFVELLEVLRHSENKLFNAIAFRRTTPQITNPGGLWDTSSSIYPLTGAKGNSNERKWFFPSGAAVKFSHLEHEKNIYDHQGAQYALVIFDELTHFTKKQFFYLLSRNRSMCGVKPYIRATCNPDPESWVAEFIEWWIDQETGLPIPERAGVLRYMLVHNENYVWGDSKEEVVKQMPDDFWEVFPDDINPHDMVKSVTFIPGTVYENKELLRTDPGYLGNLMAQDEDEKARLLFGNWKIKIDGKSLFEFYKINDLFSNQVTDTRYKCITCDASRFGRDYTVIMVWHGWKVVKIVVLMSSDEQDIVNEIESLRQKFQVPKSQVIIDQDGVGGGAVGLGDYQGFSNGGKPLFDPETGIRENYENLKTQCFFRFAEKVNLALVCIVANSETVEVVERSGRRLHGLKIKIGSKEVSIIDLIKADLRAIKKT